MALSVDSAPARYLPENIDSVCAVEDPTGIGRNKIVQVPHAFIAAPDKRMASRPTDNLAIVVNGNGFT